MQRDIRLVDEFITEAVLSALESPELAEGLRVDSADHGRVKELVADIKTYEARIQRAADACYVHDRITEDTYLDTAAQLDGMIAQARSGPWRTAPPGELQSRSKPMQRGRSGWRGATRPHACLLEKGADLVGLGR